MSLPFREQLTISIIDKAVIGLLLLVAGFAFNRMLESFKSHQTQAVEALKSGLTRELDVARERRAAVAEFARKMAAGYQEMEWLTWQARFNSKAFTAKDIEAYNRDMKALYPSIVAARVVASSVEPNSATAIKGLVDDLALLDDKLSKLCVAFQESEPRSDQQLAALQAIGELHPQILADDATFVTALEQLAGLSAGATRK